MLKLGNIVAAGLLLLGCFSFAGCGCASKTVIPKVINESESLVSLRNLNTALQLYAQDYDEIFPIALSKEDLKTQIFPYVKDNETFIDLNTNIPFEWNSFLGGKSVASMDFSPFATFYAAAPSLPDARAVVTFIGQSRLLTESDWTKLKAISHIP